jgi:hypothetical protein
VWLPSPKLYLETAKPYLYNSRIYPRMNVNKKYSNDTWQGTYQGMGAIFFLYFICIICFFSMKWMGICIGVSLAVFTTFLVNRMFYSVQFGEQGISVLRRSKVSEHIAYSDITSIYRSRQGMRNIYLFVVMYQSSTGKEKKITVDIPDKELNDVVTFLQGRNEGLVYFERE